MAAAETKEGFQFYLRFAKPLVLSLASAKDRVLAAAWVQKLKDEKSGSEKARTDHLKLLLFVLQKGRLFGPFVNNPAQHDTLEEFPIAIKLRDIAKQWVESEDARKKARLMEGLGAGDFPPLTTECSADLLEYVAAQDIPNFGVHAYYAISNEPINGWENVEKGIFPKGALSVVRKAESADISAASSKRSRQRSKSKSRTLDDSEVSGRDRSSVAQVTFMDDIGDKPYAGRPEKEKPLSPLGSPLPPARTSPTWGSNLISVGDPPSPEGMKFAPPKERVSGADKTPSKTLSMKDLSAFSLPYQTPTRRKLDFADAAATPISPIILPQIPEKFSYPEPSPKTSTPIVGLYLPPMGEGEVSDLFGEEPPSFLAGDELMMTPPPASRARLEEAPSLPYQTPPWDMTAASLPYQTPPWDMSAPSLPYQTPVRRRLDFSDVDTTPISPITFPPIPERLAYPELSPRRTTPAISRRLPTPPLTQEDASFLFEEEAPSFFDDEDIMATPTSDISPFEEAPSLPYQTPPWDMSAPSLPYQTPVRRRLDFSDVDTIPISPITFPPIPERLSYPELSPRRTTPIVSYRPPSPPLTQEEASFLFEEEAPSFFDDEDIMATPTSGISPFEEVPSLPYQTPPWDMSAPSIPYKTPDWDMSAPSLPYRTPPYDPAAMAQRQYASLFGSPEVATSSPVPQRRKPLSSEDDMDDFSLMEDMFAAEDTLGSTEDFSAIEKWAEASSEPPPAIFPRKKRTPKAEVEEVLTKGISVSPGAKDIVDEAIQEMSIVGEDQGDLEQLYEEEDAAFPGRHRGMRTPPVFSKSSRIREAGRHIRYRDTQFDIREPIEWTPADEALSTTAMPTSPPENLRDKLRQRPFKDVFPGIQIPIDYAPLDEDEEIDLVEDEELVRSPKKRDLQRRLHDVIDEIDRIGDELPVVGGVGLTTPIRSPSPVRPDRGDDDLFFFTETPPEGFGMSPEDYLSPESRAALQWAQLQESPTSPKRERTPSPPRIETPEFLRERRRQESQAPALPETETEPEALTDEDYDMEEEIVDEQTQELYKSLVQSEEEPFPSRTPPPRTPPPRTPPPRTPSPRTPPPRTPPPRTPPPRTPPPQSPGIEYPEIPPRFNVDMFGSPPRRRMTREEFPEALEFEEEPYFEEPWLRSPPTPPSPFEYESPHYSPLDDSPPIKELLEAHEFTENFFDPDRPHMRKSILLPGGKRVPVRRHSRAPPLSPIRDEHLEGLFPSPPPGDAFERALEMARQFAPPTPSPPRAPPTEQPKPEACKKAPVKAGKRVKGKAKPSTSKTKVRPSTSKRSKTRIKAPAEAPASPPSPVAGRSREKTPPAPAAATERPKLDREVHRPLTRKEHYYLKSFADPKHEDLLARVTRLIADVGFPPLESPPPERDEFENIEGTADIDISPPEFDYPADEDLPELSPERPPSPLPPIPQFDFQSDIRDFMSPPKPMRLPIVPLSPSQLPRLPRFVPPFIPFPYESPDSPGENLMETSPPFMESPPVTPRTPESPDIDHIMFMSEINAADSPTYYDYMKIRQGMGQFRIMRRHSAAPGVRRMPEAPETAEFEEHMPFYERVSSAVRPSKPRTLRAGPRRLRPSAAPGLAAVTEQIDYPESPLTTRSPTTPPRIVSPPRRRPVVDKRERLIDVSPEPLTPEGPPKATRIKRRVTRRRIDFDAPPPTPEHPPPDKMKGERRPGRPGRRIDFGEPPRRTDYFPQFQIELTEEELGPPPEELMGERYPMEYESPQESIIDDAIPDLPSPTVRPRRGDTPPSFLRPPTPKKEFEFKLLPRLKHILDFQSPIEFPPSPEPLPEEMEKSPLATAMPGFAPSPPPTPISPYELPPSIEKKFGRQVTPEVRRKHPMAARLITPPRVDRQLDAALLAAHRQYQELLMDTPPTTHAEAARPSPSRRVPSPPRRTSPVAGPSRHVTTTSETVISPRERRTTTTKTETMGSPFTPPMMILPPQHVDPFLSPPDIDIFSEEMPELMEPSPEEVMRMGVIKAPERTTRRPVQLYGYGERKPIQLPRKQRPPGLSIVPEVTDEPADQYEYWPGAHIPQVSKPSPTYTGGKLAPAIYRNVPPVSGKGAVADEWDTTRAYAPPIRAPPQPPRMLSPAQTPRKRRGRIPKAVLTARRRLDFDQPPSPKTYEEYLEQLVADVPLPEGDLDVPQLPPAVYIEFEPPAWSPVPITALQRHDAIGLESEEPPDWEQFESPRTPRKSPELPFVDMDDMLADVSPPIDLAADLSFSPVDDVSPPPGMEELDELEATPPCGTCDSPEELQRRIREHEYTIHKGDTRKRHLASKRVHVKGRPYRVRKSQAPSLIPLQEQEEPSESPKRRVPRYVPLGTLLDITPPPRDEMQDLVDITQRQYAMLMDSLERQSPDVMETATMEEYVLDQPIGAQAHMALPLPITQRVDFGSPLLPPPTIPARYIPPPPSSPELFTTMAPLHDDYMLDYVDSPPFITTPPRDIFAEAMEMEEEEEEDMEALLTGSPVRRTPPDNNCIQLNTDNEMEALTKQKPIMQHYSTVFSHFYTKYPYNELSYCLEKGLDYFPVKESDANYTVLLLDFEAKNCAPTININNGKNLNLFAETKFSPCIDAIIAPDFTFSLNNLFLSEFIVAFHYFLHSEESVEETLPHYRSQTTTESGRSTLSPARLAVPQQQFRHPTPNRAAAMAPQRFTSINSQQQQFHQLNRRPMRFDETYEQTLSPYSPETTMEQTQTLSPIRLGIPQQQFRPLSPAVRMSPRPMPFDNLQQSPDRNAMRTIYRAPINANSSGSLSYLERAPRAMDSPLNTSARLRDGLNMPRRRALPLQLSGNAPSPISHVGYPDRLRFLPRQRALPLQLSRTLPSPILEAASPVRLQGNLNMPRRRALPLQLSETLPSSIPDETPPIRMQGNLNMPRQRALPLQLSETLPSSTPPVSPPIRLQGNLNMSRQRALPFQLSETLPSSIPAVTPPIRMQGNLNMPRQRALPLQLSETLPSSTPPVSPPIRLQGNLNMSRQHALLLPHVAPLQRYSNSVFDTLPEYQSNLPSTASPYAFRTESRFGPYASRLATVNSMSVPPSTFNTSVGNNQLPEIKNCVQPAIPLCACVTEYVNKILRNFIAPRTLAEPSRVQDSHQLQERIIANDEPQASLNIRPLPDMACPTSQRAFDTNVLPGFPSAIAERSQMPVNFQRDRTLTPIRKIRKRLFATSSPGNGTATQCSSHVEDDNLEVSHDSSISRNLPLRRLEIQSAPQPPRTFANFQDLRRGVTTTPVRADKRYFQAVSPHSSYEANVMPVQSLPFTSEVEDGSTSYLDYVPYQTSRRDGPPRKTPVGENNIDDSPRSLPLTFPKSQKLKSAAQQPHTVSDFDYLRKHKASPPAKRINRRLFETLSSDKETDFESAPFQSRVEEDEIWSDASNLPHSSPKREVRNVPPRPSENRRKPHTSVLDDIPVDIDESPHQEPGEEESAPNAQIAAHEFDVEDGSKSHSQTHQVDENASENEAPSSEDRPEEGNVLDNEAIAIEPPMLKKDATNYIMESTPKTSIPVSIRSRNISKPLSPTQIRDADTDDTKDKALSSSVTDTESRTTSELCPGCGLDPDREFSLTTALPEDISEPKVNVDRKEHLSAIPERRSSPVNDSYPEPDSEAEYNIVRKQLFSPTSKSDSTPLSNVHPVIDPEPQYGTARKRPTDDSYTESDPESEYNAIRKPPINRTFRLSSSTYGEYGECNSEPEYNIVRKQLFTPTSKRGTFSRPTYQRDSRFADHSCPGCDSEPEYNAVRKRHTSPTPKRDLSPGCDKCKRIFSSTSKRASPSKPRSKRGSRSADDSCPGCDSEAEDSMVPKRRFTTRNDSTSANVHDSADHLCPGYTSDPDYNVGGKQIFISTIKSTPRRFSTDHVKSPDNCGCSENKIIDDQLTADISRHLNKLPTNDISNNQSGLFSAPTHLIISAFGPVHLSTIPNVSSNQTYTGPIPSEVSAPMQQIDSEKMKELDEETETSDKRTADDKAVPEIVITPVSLPQNESRKSDATPAVDRKVSVRGSLSDSSKSPAPGALVPLESSPSRSKEPPSMTPKSSQVTPAKETPLSQAKKSPTVTPKSSKPSRLPTPKGSKTASIKNETLPKTSCAALCTKTPRPSSKKLDGKLHDETSAKAGSNVCSEGCTQKFERSRSKLDGTYTVVTSKQSGTCPQLCTKASTSNRGSLPEKTTNVLDNVRDENLLRNIVLDTETSSKSRTPSIKLKDSKIKANKGTCTSEICTHIPVDRKLCMNPTCSTALYENKCPSSVCESDVTNSKPQYTAKYFKNSPCLDISMPSRCLNPQCGLQGAYQEPEQLILEDWADELEVLSDPGYRSIQTQYFHSEVTNKRSDTSGCCCGYCDGEGGSQFPGSPVSPDFMKRIREHQYTESFFDPKRPMARKSVRSRENVVRLRRKAPPPPLEQVYEVPEQPVISPDTRGLRPTIYPTAIPLSAEEHYTPPYFPEFPRTRKVRAPPLQPPRTPIKSVQRAPPRRRLLFDEPPPSPERTPNKVTTTEMVTYDDPSTGVPITETTVKETVYERGGPGSPIRKTPTPERKTYSPYGPCTPPRISPREYDISGAFGGRISPEILDTSDIPEDVDTEPFAWLDR